jgi:polysaccharide deacetylase 2 family uncharacterized protein YibQ
MSSRKHSYKKKYALFSLFAVFIFISLLAVVILEYLDFKSGKDSFIFEKIIRLERVSGKKDDPRHLNRNLLNFFKKNKFKYNYFLDQNKIYHFKLDIDQKKLEKTVAEIKKIIIQSRYHLELSEAQKLPEKTIYLYHIQRKKDITHHLLITGWMEIKKPEIEKKVDNQPKIAFIIDDVGYREGISRELNKLNIPITASILPETPYAFDEANRIKQYGLQAMIHLPMQPKNSNKYSPNGYRVIKPDSENWEIKNIIRFARQVIPYATGVNNHEGSLVTSEQKIMTRVLRIVKSEGLFFVDSRTTPDTVAYEVAKNLNMKAAFRDIFLDSNHSYLFSIEQIHKLITLARHKKKAIAIGHPFDTTFQAIKDSINMIREQGIKIVFVSELLD